MNIMLPDMNLLTKPRSSWASIFKSVPADEDYVIVMAANGYSPSAVNVSAGTGNWQWIDENEGIFSVTIRHEKTSDMNWQVKF